MSYSANRLLLFTVVIDTKVHALSPVCCHGKWIKLKNFKAQKAFSPANSVAQASWTSSPRVTDEAFSKAVNNECVCHLLELPTLLKPILCLKSALVLLKKLISYTLTVEAMMKFSFRITFRVLRNSMVEYLREQLCGSCSKDV